MAGKYQDIDPQHVANVIACVNAATPEERDAGQTWYPAYGAWIKRHALALGFSEDQGCAVFAVLSPQARIDRNRAMFMAALQGGAYAQGAHFTPDQPAKVAAILAGATIWENLGRPDGALKVRNFYRNLCGDMDGVTVDTHAASMVFGEMFGSKKSVGDGMYHYCERVIKIAAVLLDMTPAECQAVGWTAWRRLKGIQDNGGVKEVAA